LAGAELLPAERPADRVDPFLAAARRQHTILVDACSGNHKPRPGMPRFDVLNSSISTACARAGVEPEEIDYDVHHLHVDHVG
jgi:hypothetical protein